MKKSIITLCAAAVLFGAVSCNQSGSKSTVSSAADSIAMAQGYLTGQSLGQQFMMSAMQGMPIDTAEFLKGFKAGIADTAKISYFIGQIQGAQMAQGLAKDSINIKIFAEYLEAGLMGDTVKFTMTPGDAQTFIQSYYQKKQEAEMRTQYGDNDEIGKKALAKFASEEGVQKTSSGIAYKYITKGSGKTPTETDMVKVNYRGTLVDGTEFDKNEDIEFPVSGVIKGWTELLLMMKEGDKILAYIPQELAYGSQDRGTIKPFSTLIFEMELLQVKASEE